MSRAFIVSIVALGVAFAGWYAFQDETAIPGGTAAAASAGAPAYRYANASADDIFVISPKPGDAVSSTILIKGYARGGWYFEGVFPVEVRGSNGLALGSGAAKAVGDWTSDSFVGFSAQIALKSLAAGRVTIVLKKDNPSGDPSKDASVSIPVMIQ